MKTKSTANRKERKKIPGCTPPPATCSDASGVSSWRRLFRENVDKNRKKHNKKPLKDKEDGNNNDNPSSGKPEKTEKMRTTDPESG